MAPASGRFAPQLEKAAKLAVALEVALDELIGRDTPEVTEDVRDPKLRSRVRALEQRRTDDISTRPVWRSRASRLWRGMTNSRPAGRGAGSRSPAGWVARDSRRAARRSSRRITARPLRGSGRGQAGRAVEGLTPAGGALSRCMRRLIRRPQHLRRVSAAGVGTGLGDAEDGLKIEG